MRDAGSESHLARQLFIVGVTQIKQPQPPYPLLSFCLFLLFTNSFSREVKQEALSEPAGQVAMELEGRSHSESAMRQSDHQGAESSDSHPEEVRRPTERRPGGNYNPEIWWGDNWSLWGSSSWNFWSQSNLIVIFLQIQFRIGYLTAVTIILFCFSSYSVVEAAVAMSGDVHG